MNKDIQQNTKGLFMKLLRNWRLHLPFMILPGIALVNSLIILLRELVPDSVSNAVNCLGFSFDPSHSYSFYLMLWIISALSLLLILSPTLLIWFFGFFQTRLNHDVKSVGRRFSFGIWLVAALIILRGINSIVGLYLITAYYFDGPILFMVILWFMILIKNIFTVASMILQLGNETGQEYLGLVEEEPGRFMPELDSEDFTLIVGIEPTLKLTKSTVDIPHQKRKFDSAIYIGLPLLHLLPKEQIITYIEAAKKRTSPLQDWCVSCRNVYADILRKYSNGKPPPPVQPIMAFVDMYLTTLEVAPAEHPICETSIKIALIKEFWQRKVLPTLEGNLQLGRETEHWCLTLIDNLKSLNGTIQKDIINMVEDSLGLSQDTAFGPQAFNYELCGDNLFQDLFQDIPEELILLDRQVSAAHIKWLKDQGRAG